MFAEARRNAPTALIVDEFDSIAFVRRPEPQRDEEDEPAPGSSLVSVIAAEIDNISSEVPVLVIGTTNRVDLIDSALLRPSRFRPRAVGLPDLDARHEIIGIIAAKFGVPLTADLAEMVAASTHEFTGDEIREVFRIATRRALREERGVDATLLGEAVGHARNVQIYGSR